MSCAPVWAHPDVKNNIKNGESYEKLANDIPWRDHWMQAIYYLPNDLHISPEKEVFLAGLHDEYSFWFSLDNTKLYEIDLLLTMFFSNLF